MPELDDPTDPLEPDEPYGAADDGDQFREMRKAANKAAKLAKDNAALQQRISEMERKVALGDAGLALSPKQQAALLAAHGDAEMTRDALRATAAELNFIQPDEPDEARQEREAALAGAQRIGEAQKGAPPPAPAAPIRERIAQAEADGDFTTSGLLKAQQVAQLLYAGQTVQIS